jgi:hypothetical protein
MYACVLDDGNLCRMQSQLCAPLYCCSGQHPGNGEQHQAHFRSMSASHPQSQSTVPQTGLGILMGGNGKPMPLLAPHRFSGSSTNDQQTRIHEDLADRERQAAALASAGMVAESVNYTRAANVGQVLQAPPPLVGMAPLANSNPTNPSSSASTNNKDITMEAINWNNMADLGNPDDMDMDFAAMFDPEQELAYVAAPNRHTRASSPSKTSTGIPNPLNTKV